MHNSRSAPTAVQRVATPKHEKAWAQEQGRAHRVFAKMASDISSAAERGRRVQPVLRNFLRDPLVQFSAALRTLGEDPDRHEAEALSREVRALISGKISAPTVPWFPMQKSNGGSRPICVLPPALKAVHIILREALQAQFAPSSPMYGIRGLGTADAAHHMVVSRMWWKFSGGDLRVVWFAPD